MRPLNLKLVALTAQDGEEKPSALDGAPALVVQDCELRFELDRLLAHPAQDGEEKPSARDGAPAPGGSGVCFVFN